MAPNPGVGSFLRGFLRLGTSARLTNRSLAEVVKQFLVLRNDSGGFFGLGMRRGVAELEGAAEQYDVRARKHVQRPLVHRKSSCSSPSMQLASPGWKRRNSAAAAVPSVARGTGDRPPLARRITNRKNNT